jgi:hypothetical protein
MWQHTVNPVTVSGRSNSNNLPTTGQALRQKWRAGFFFAALTEKSLQRITIIRTIRIMAKSRLISSLVAPRL